MNKAEQLQELKEIFEGGLITKEEYDESRKKVLNLSSKSELKVDSQPQNIPNQSIQAEKKEVQAEKKEVPTESPRIKEIKYRTKMLIWGGIGMLVLIVVLAIFTGGIGLITVIVAIVALAMDINAISSLKTMTDEQFELIKGKKKHVSNRDIRLLRKNIWRQNKGF